MSITITYPGQALAAAGIDPNTAWADDPNLTTSQQAALRALGRSEVQRRYNEVGQYLNTAGQGMGADGRQTQVTPPPMPVNVPDMNGMAADGGQRSPTGGSQSVQGMTDEQLAALIAQYQQQFQQNQQPAVQPEMYTYQGATQAPQSDSQSDSQGGSTDTNINTPDYGQVQQRPAYDFSQQQQTQPMSIKQAQVNNFHNAAHSDWEGKQQEMMNGLLDMGQYRQQMGLLG